MVNSLANGSRNSPEIIELSVIIVNWNTRDLLRRCLRSVISQLKGYRAEVVVVDNGSHDDSVGMVRDEFSECRLIALERNESFAMGTNRGIRASRGRFLLLVNSDASLRPGCLQKLYEYLVRSPGTALVGPRLLNPDSSVQFSIKSRPTLLTAFLDYSLLDQLFPRNRFFGHYNQEFLNYTQDQEVEQLMAAVVMVRREAIEEVGLLDPNLSLYFNDTDWCLRMRQAGWQIRYVFRAEAVHLGGGTTSIADHNLALLPTGYRNLFYLFWKYYGTSSLYWLRVMIFWGFLVRMVGLILLRLLRNDIGGPKRWEFAKRSLIVALTPSELLPRTHNEQSHEKLCPKNLYEAQEVDSIRSTSNSQQLQRQIELSLIVISWNRRDILHKCLSALAEACKEKPWEVIVVDNHSSDGSPDMVRHTFGGVKLIPLFRNLGFGRACNIGFQASNSEYLLILNSDIIADYGEIRQLLTFIRQNPQIGAVGPALIDLDSRLEPSWGKDPNLRNEFYQKWILRPKVRSGDYRESCGHSRKVDWVSGAFLLTRRAALVDTEGFDQRFFLYFEDNDLCLRMRASGWEVWYNPGIRVVHQQGSSVKMVANEVAWEYRRSQLLYYWKHHKTLSLTFLRFFLLGKAAGSLLKGLLWGFKLSPGYSQLTNNMQLAKLAMKENLWFMARSEEVSLAKDPNSISGVVEK